MREINAQKQMIRLFFIMLIRGPTKLLSLSTMKKEIRKTFGFAREKFSAKVRLDTKMSGVPIILSKSICVQYVSLAAVFPLAPLLMA